MNRAALVAVAALIVVVAVTGGYLANRYRFTAEPGMTAEPDIAPDRRIAFTLPDLEGNPRSLEEWRGQPLLINFWATWCAPCRREIPLLKEIQSAHGDDLQVIGVAVDDVEEVAAYAQSAGFNYPVLVGQEEAIAAAETSGMDFLGLPVTLVVAADGALIRTHIGEIFEEDLEEIVSVLARLRAGEIDIAQARAALRGL